MTAALRHLAPPALRGLAQALLGGRLGAPYAAAAVGRHVERRLSGQVAAALQHLADHGTQPAGIADVLQLLAAEKEAAQQARDGVELVWTAPEVPGDTGRDTAVVTRDLLAGARRRVLLASYALDRGERARGLFEGLAERMDERPELEARLIVNVFRPRDDDRPAAVILRAFAESFRNELWPGHRLPRVYHDPRSLVPDGGPRACQHAKVVVVDDRRVLLSSANFTEAAQERNIEAGVLIDDPVAAADVTRQFDALILAGVLQPVAGLG